MLPEYSTTLEHYRICSLVGQCSTDIGVVFVARHSPTADLVAIKKFNLDKLDDETVQLIQNEVIVMRQLSHQNLLPCLTSFVNGLDVMTVTPLMGYGSCRDIMTRHFNAGLPEAAIAYILRDVLLALRYIHQKGFIHRAIRASHILVSAKGTAVLTGLRYCASLCGSGFMKKNIHSFPLSTCANLNWLSPEVLQQDLLGYGEKSDVYSVGVTACELANGIVPFHETATTLMLTEKIGGSAPQLLDCTTYFVYSGSASDGDIGIADIRMHNENAQEYTNRKFSDPFHALSELCCQREPNDRPAPAQLLNHAFFKQTRRPYGGGGLTELLLPAIPFTSDNLGYLEDDIQVAADRLSSISVSDVDWDF